MIDAPDELEVSVSEPAGQVSGPVQARFAASRERVANEALPGLLRVIEVAATHCRAADTQLSSDSDRHRLKVSVQDIEACVCNRTADRHVGERHRRRRRHAMRCHVVGTLRRAVSVDQGHAGELPEPIKAEVGSRGLAGANQPTKSTQCAKDGLVGRPIQNRAQQRRYDLQHRHPLAPYLLYKQRRVPHLLIGTDVDASADHECSKELPDRNVEALGRRLGNDVAGR